MADHIHPKDFSLDNLWDRLESMEDVLVRMSVYGLFPAERDPAAENDAIAGFRANFPYRDSDPDHYKQNTPNEEV